MNLDAGAGRLIDRLDLVLAAAHQTEFYRKAHPPLKSNLDTVERFRAAPVTPISKYRAQRLPATLTDPSATEWIVGPHRGHSPCSLAYVEDATAAQVRFDLYSAALRHALPELSRPMAAVVATARSRYFGAELASIMVRMGVPAHLFVDLDRRRRTRVLEALNPTTLVTLDEALGEESVPSSVGYCVTVRDALRFHRRHRLDLYAIDELGLLGWSLDGELYTLNHEDYYFEQSESGRLIVTSLYNLIQPKLRIETLDEVGFLDQGLACLNLSAGGG